MLLKGHFIQTKTLGTSSKDRAATLSICSGTEETPLNTGLVFQFGTKFSFISF